MFDDEIGAREVTDVRPASGVVHGVGQVAHENDVLAVFRHLTQAEGASQNTHVGVHSDEEHILDLAVLEHIPDFNAVVADRILVVYLDNIDLALPRPVLHVTPHRPELSVPLLVFIGVVVYTTV